MATDLREPFHIQLRRKRHILLKFCAKLAVKALQALCLRKMLLTPLLSTAMLSSLEPTCPESAAAGRTVVVLAVEFMGYGQEAQRI